MFFIFGKNDTPVATPAANKKIFGVKDTPVATPAANKKIFGAKDTPTAAKRDISWWYEPVPKKLQRIGKQLSAVPRGVAGLPHIKMWSGVAEAITEPSALDWAWSLNPGLKGGVGVAEAITKLTDPLAVNWSWFLNPVKEQIREWGEQTRLAVDQHFRENPEDAINIEAQGFLPVIGELLANPDKFLGAAIQNLPLMLESTLATMITGGLGAVPLMTEIAGGATMAVPVFGDIYNEARAEGDSPNTALARATCGAPFEAAIEQYSVGRQLGLMRKVMGGKSLRGARKLAWEANKIYWRGTAEEGSQKWNRNCWRWMFSDRTTDLMQNVAESAAMGGPLELAMGGPALIAGIITTPHKVAERIRRMEKIRETANADPDLNDAAKEEVNNTIDIIEEQFIEETIEILRERFPQAITDDASLTEVGNAIADDFGIDVPIEWKFKKSNKPKSYWGTHLLRDNKHTITIFSQPGHNSQNSLKETLVHELDHIVNPPKYNKKPPLSRLPKNFIVKEIRPGDWRVGKPGHLYGVGSTKEEAVEQALQNLNQERQYPRRRVVHYPEFNEWEEAHKKKLFMPVEVAAPGETYEDAQTKQTLNPYIRLTDAKNNKGRSLLIQISDTLTAAKEDPRAKRYYRKLYSGIRRGYNRPADFMELPQWAAEIANFKRADILIVRDIDAAKELIQNAGYDEIMFSVMDSNKDIVRDLAESYAGKVIVGGYGTALSDFQNKPNVKIYNDPVEMAKQEGWLYSSGLNIDHFKGTKTIPRLCLSKGCLHKCAFCIVPKKLQIRHKDNIRFDAAELADLEPELVYIDDKTFGQAENYTALIDIYKIFKDKNPRFQGFIIQTTPGQFQKLNSDFLQKAHVKYVEFGIESYNDEILKNINKPTNEKAIQRAMDKARNLGISVIPNILIGLPGETAETYQHTLDFIRTNADTISHLNIYAFSPYAGTEIAKQIEAKEDIDVDENQVTKSFHKDPALHEQFADEIYALGEALLNRPTPTDVAYDVEGYEARRPPKKSKKALLYLGHEIPKRQGITEDELKQEKIRVTKQFSGRDDIDSMGKMTKPEMENWVAYLEDTYGGIEYTAEDLVKPIQVDNRVTNMAAIIKDIEKILDALPERVKIPEHIARKYRRKLEGGNIRKAWDFLIGVDNSTPATLAWILGGGRDSIFTEVFRDNIWRGQTNMATHGKTVYDFLKNELNKANITDNDLARMFRSLNPRFAFLDNRLLTGVAGVETETLPRKIGKRTYDLSWGQLIHLYLYATQEQGLEYILSSGLEINGVRTGPLTPGELETLMGEVEANPKALKITELIRQVDKLYWKPAINQVSMRLLNKPIATVKNWFALEIADEETLAGKTFEINLIENKTILKPRPEGMNKALVLRDAMSVFDKLETAISEYYGMAEPTRLARTILNHQNIASALRRKGYAKTRKNLLTIFKRAQSIPAEEGTFGKLVRGMLFSAYRAVVSLSVGIVASQKTSEANYIGFINPKYYPIAAKNALSREAMTKTLELSPMAWARFYMGYGTYELGEIMAQDGILAHLTGKPSWKNRATIGLKAADLSALTTGMEIAKLEYIDAQKGIIEGESALWWEGRNTSFKEGTENWRQIVAQRAEYLWRQTQPSWDKWNRSVNLGQPSTPIRVVSGMLFRSFWEKALNIQQQALIEFQNSPKNVQDYTRAARKIGAVMSGIAVNVALRAAILAAMTGEIKKPWEYIIDLITAPFAMIPLVGRPIKNTIRNFTAVLKREKVKFFGRISEQLPFSIVQTLMNGINNFATGTAFYLRGDEEQGKKNYKKALNKIYEAVGLLNGVPVYEIRKVTTRFEKEKKSVEGKFYYTP